MAQQIHKSGICLPEDMEFRHQPHSHITSQIKYFTLNLDARLQESHTSLLNLQLVKEYFILFRIQLQFIPSAIQQFSNFHLLKPVSPKNKMWGEKTT
jgi:hypothetical protein